MVVLRTEDEEGDLEDEKEGGEDHYHNEAMLRSIPRFVVRLPQFSNNEVLSGRSGILTLENFSVGLAERLLLSSSDFEVLDFRFGLDQTLYEKHNALEATPIIYLAQCYSRADMERSKSSIRKTGQHNEVDDEFSKMKSKIIEKCKCVIASKASIVIQTDHAKAMLQSPQQTAESDFTALLKKTITQGSSVVPVQFFYDIAQTQCDNLDVLKSIFNSILEDLHLTAQLSTTELNVDLSVIEFFSSHPALSKVLTSFKHWLPNRDESGKRFETQTILGRLLCRSSIPQLPQVPSTYFPVDRPFYSSEVQATTLSIRDELEHEIVKVYKIFSNLLRACPESKKALLTWLVSCLESNSDRGKMASRFNRALATQASDGFFLNLCWVMLRLCSPFLISDESDSTRKARIRTIDVSYVNCDKSKVKFVDSSGPLVNFSEDSKLVPLTEIDHQDITVNVPFNFITHCFFLTHKCLIYGLTHIIHKCQDIMRTLSHLHNALDGATDMTLDALPGTPLWQFRVLSSQLLGIKAHAFHPSLMELCLSFYCTTAYWMVQLVTGDNERICEIPIEPPPLVQIIPECLVENMSNIVMALRQMDSQLTIPSEHIHHYISFCTIYMRSSKFINNPHIRAKLAQLLQFFIQKDEDSANMFGDVVQRDSFAFHSLACNHLIPALLSIFVDIEHTGESMEFEDKFAYRLPMYKILEFLWVIPSYRPCIDRLTEEVIAHSDTSVSVPVFLRFINMIINDAILQLDEGLDSLATIKKLEDLESSDEWDNFSADRKKEHSEKLKEAKMYAVNRNKLADQTVNVLKIITTDTRQPFVIHSIVDRMTSMLNYVLKQLVGKKSKNLKVREADKYNFDPRTLVKNIVGIYLNLGQENSFCEALPRDGRSFSIDLFSQAERVLWIISGDQDSLISEWRILAERVKKSCNQLLLEETVFENPPDEFLDPLTQELMVDPVILPTSGHTLDKSSIMRHLLSDQQDPFNRAPLTPDMLQPNYELREKILQWKQKKLADM